MRRILIKTAINRGYRVFELRNKAGQMKVAVLKDNLSVVVHDITNSRFVSMETLIGSTDSRFTEYEQGVLKMTLIDKVINFLSASSGKEVTDSFCRHER